MGWGLSPWSLAGFGRGTEETGSGACGRRGVSRGEGKGPDRTIMWLASDSQGRLPTVHRICRNLGGLGGWQLPSWRRGVGITVFTPTPDFHMAGISSKGVG